MCITNTKGFVIWHRFDFTYSILDYCFCVYFGSATYVDYLTFSHLNWITNPTPRPNATLTIGATARNPNYPGSRVYPNYRGCRTQPQQLGQPHATLMVRAAGRGLVGAGGVLGLRPCGSRYALPVRALPSRFVLHAHSSGFALAVRITRSQQSNEFMYYN